MTPRVLNKRTMTLADRAQPSVYVGRPTKWGNPYSHLWSAYPGTIHVNSRAEAVDLYRKWIFSHPELLEAARKELRGKNLTCWCAPHQCHADILLVIANAD